MNKFDFSNNHVLEDDRVKLIPLQLDHIDHLLYYAINEPQIWKYSLLQADSEDKMRGYIQLAVDKREQQKEYPFIVYDKNTGEYAGSTRLFEIQFSNKSLQLGFTWYGEKFHGNGLNKHCKYLLLCFAFEEMDMERVEFRADIRNEKSIAAMKSIGCVVEGVLRKNIFNPDGGRRDSIVLSILREEWLGEVKSNLKSKLS